MKPIRLGEIKEASCGTKVKAMLAEYRDCRDCFFYTEEGCRPSGLNCIEKNRVYVFKEVAE